jgi:3-oxoacyl-[acyl-carrier protein] reductase
MMIDLGGKKALITGGSRGIGRATAILLAKAGADVAVNYTRNDQAAEETRQEVHRTGRECLLLKADVSHKTEVDVMVEKLLSEWERVDILVNNAGIWTYGEMGSMEENIWEETIHINLDSIYFLCNAIIPSMKSRQRGWIVNVSSTAGQRGEAFHSHYAATKGALIALTKSLAVELAPYNIRVNCVAPGWVDTDMCSRVFQETGFREKIEASIPLQRVAPPEDIAAPILFLVSDLARHITGEVLNVNGGSILCG